jgi:fermentation-respiration switch protein FrsA (DUF1100 family)
MCCLKGMSWIIILVLGAAVILSYLRAIEKKIIFYPTREIDFSPKELDLEFEEIFFKAKDNVELNAWFLPNRTARYTVIFSHGNAGNISHRLEKLKFFYDLGCSCFIFDYRGYGKSKGSPSEKGLYLDAQAAYDYLLSRGIKPEQIIGYGESIGGAVTIDLASKNKMAAIIVDSSFSNARDMTSVIYPFLPYQIFSSRFDSLNKIQSVKIPKLIIHSVNDEIVPYRLGKKLFDYAPGPKAVLAIRGGHNSCFFESEPALKEKITDCLERIKK